MRTARATVPLTVSSILLVSDATGVESFTLSLVPAGIVISRNFGAGAALAVAAPRAGVDALAVEDPDDGLLAALSPDALAAGSVLPGVADVCGAPAVCDGADPEVPGVAEVSAAGAGAGAAAPVDAGCGADCEQAAARIDARPSPRIDFVMTATSIRPLLSQKIVTSATTEAAGTRYHGGYKEGRSKLGAHCKIDNDQRRDRRIRRDFRRRGL
jgi:hypothetical protein